MCSSYSSSTLLNCGICQHVLRTVVPELGQVFQMSFYECWVEGGLFLWFSVCLFAECWGDTNGLQSCKAMLQTHVQFADCQKLYALSCRAATWLGGTWLILLHRSRCKTWQLDCWALGCLLTCSSSLSRWLWKVSSYQPHTPISVICEIHWIWLVAVTPWATDTLTLVVLPFPPSVHTSPVCLSRECKSRGFRCLHLALKNGSCFFRYQA